MKRDIAILRTPTRLDHMIDIVLQHVLDDQRVATAIPFLSLLRSSHPTPVTKGVLKPSCCVILQGQQRVHLADDMLDYGPGEYRVVSVDMRASGHIINTTTAAGKIGHESTPQFSREYRRLFGAPPMQDIKKLRTTP